MLLEPISQVRKSPHRVVMADCSARCFPDVLLRVQVRSGDRESDELQARIRLQDITYRLTGVPRCAVPQENDRYIGYRCQNLFQVACCRFCIHLFGARGNDLSGVQIERTVEVDLLPSWMRTNYRRLTARCPHSHCRCLEVQPSFVFGQEHGLR